MITSSRLYCSNPSLLPFPPMTTSSFPYPPFLYLPFPYSPVPSTTWTSLLKKAAQIMTNTATCFISRADLKHHEAEMSWGEVYSVRQSWLNFDFNKEIRHDFQTFLSRNSYKHHCSTLRYFGKKFRNYNNLGTNDYVCTTKLQNSVRMSSDVFENFAVLGFFRCWITINLQYKVKIYLIVPRKKTVDTSIRS